MIHRHRQECLHLKSSPCFSMQRTTFDSLQPAPVYGVVYGIPPHAETGGRARYLWVIDEIGIPYLQECPIDGLGGALPKHTNLTGGRPAYIGGEVCSATAKVSTYQEAPVDIRRVTRRS